MKTEKTFTTILVLSSGSDKLCITMYAAYAKHLLVLVVFVRNDENDSKKIGFCFCSLAKISDQSFSILRYYTNLIHSFKSCKKLVFLKKTINLLFNGIVHFINS